MKYILYLRYTHTHTHVYYEKEYVIEGYKFFANLRNLNLIVLPTHRNP